MTVKIIQTELTLPVFLSIWLLII